MFSCCTPRSLEVSLAMVLDHADEGMIRQLVIALLRKYAASTTNALDDEIVDIVDNCLKTGD